MLKTVWNIFLDFLAAYSIIFSIALVVFYIRAITTEDYSYSNYAESVESAGASVDIITRKEIERQNHQRNFWKPRFASN